MPDPSSQLEQELAAMKRRVPNAWIACWTMLSGAVVLSAGALAVAAEPVKWPGFRGPGGQGVSKEQGLPLEWGPDENIVWKKELPGAGTSSPIILDDRIYLTCFRGFGVSGEPGDMEDLERHVLCLAADGG